MFTLAACGFLDDKTTHRLRQAINALDTVQGAQTKLHNGAAGSENDGLEKRLNFPIRQLRQAFVRKVDAAVRKVDKTKLSKRDRETLQP